MSLQSLFAMQLLLLRVSAAVVIAGLHWTVEGLQDNHQNDPGQDSVTCNFEEGLCDWNTTTPDGYNLAWTYGQGAATTGHYVFIDVYQKAAGKKGRLASPKLQPKVGYECELSFKYCFVGACGLQVAVVVEDDFTGDVTEITQYNRTGPSTCRVSDGSAFVNCSKSAYWIYFDGVVLSNDNTNCGGGSAIVVDNIEYNVKNRRTSPASVTSMPAPTTTTTPTTATTATTSTTPATTSGETLPTVSVTSTLDSQSKPESQSGGLGSGAVAAVIVVVVALVVVVVVVVVLVLRRRRGQDSYLTICLQKKHSKSSASKNGTSAAANPAFVSHDPHRSGGGGGLGKETDDGYSEVATPTDHGYNEPDADHVYSEMEDLKPGQTHTVDGYALVNKPLKVTPNNNEVPSNGLSIQKAKHLQNPRCGSRGPSLQGSHSQQRGPPALSGDQTRSSASYENAHVEPRNLRATKKPGQAKLPPDNTQYSLARVPNPSASEEEATSPYHNLEASSDYEAVDDGKRSVATLSDDDGYNHIGGSAKGGQQLKTAVSDDDAYNHIGGPGKDDDDDYNHISGSGNGGKLVTTAACEDDAYNHIHGSSEDKMEGDHYNHFKERDEYHRLNTEQRTRDEQRELAESDYSHISP